MWPNPHFPAKEIILIWELQLLLGKYNQSVQERSNISLVPLKNLTVVHDNRRNQLQYLVFIQYISKSLTS